MFRAESCMKNKDFAHFEHEILKLVCKICHYKTVCLSCAVLVMILW